MIFQVGNKRFCSICRGGGMADTADLKSAGSTPVPVRVRSSASVTPERRASFT